MSGQIRQMAVENRFLWEREYEAVGQKQACDHKNKFDWTRWDINEHNT
jgi:hypothetical protein